MHDGFVTVEWLGSWGRLRAYEPTIQQIEAAAPRLASFYNDPYNRDMMTNDEGITPDDVVEEYLAMPDEGGRGFLLDCNDELVGDADLRNPGDGIAEFAIMLGDKRFHGRGFGLRFAVMIHLATFRHLSMVRLYATIRPHNRPSLRMFEKLGYAIDDSSEARAYAELPDDVCLSIDRRQFEALHGGVFNEIQSEMRLQPSP
jgi:RimJ/RimL family protein N-acetyltransferase